MVALNLLPLKSQYSIQIEGNESNPVGVLGALMNLSPSFSLEKK
jgi:hypothetical protein